MQHLGQATVLWCRVCGMLRDIASSKSGRGSVSEIDSAWRHVRVSNLSWGITTSVMVLAAGIFSGQTQLRHVPHATNETPASIRNKDVYVATLNNCKISLCPRGSNYETYRFFESIKSGCVVVSDRLPRSWFYSGHPAIEISDWSELPNVLDTLLSCPECLEGLSRAAATYWDMKLSETAVANKISQFLLDLTKHEVSAST
jgi:hypothetical protein